MPELPDITTYVDGLERTLVDRQLQAVEIASPFVLRTVSPSAADLVGQTVRGASRLNKRLVLHFDADVHLVIHLMIAGRLRWREPGKKPPGGPKNTLARFEVAEGSVWLTEASSKKRASMHVVQGPDALAPFDRGGLEVLEANRAQFEAALTRENRTLKRALTDPRILSGIGNSYSDEILFAARLSPMLLTQRLDAEQLGRLFDATQSTLTAWIARLRDEVGEGFPEKVTAFHPEMHVHGRYNEPCRVCAAKVQRIRYASNEANYCAACQNAGRLLADRGLSQLMRKDWPKTLEALEELRGDQSNRKSSQ